jgi:hypothetical protein
MLSTVLVLRSVSPFTRFATPVLLILTNPLPACAVKPTIPPLENVVLTGVPAPNIPAPILVPAESTMMLAVTLADIIAAAAVRFTAPVVAVAEFEIEPPDNSFTPVPPMTRAPVILPLDSMLYVVPALLSTLLPLRSVAPLTILVIPVLLMLTKPLAACAVKATVPPPENVVLTGVPPPNTPAPILVPAERMIVLAVTVPDVIAPVAVKLAVPVVAAAEFDIEAPDSSLTPVPPVAVAPVMLPFDSKL